MAKLLSEVPGITWTTTRQLEAGYAKSAKRDPKPIPDEKNEILIELPENHRRRNGAPWTIHIPHKVWSKAGGLPIRAYRASGLREDYWAYKKHLYVTKDQRLKPEDVAALVEEAENTRRLRLERAHSVSAMASALSSRTKRQPIPQDVKVAVWQRDGGRCVECQRNEELEFDHIIPLAMGGSNTMRNLQLLCAQCNRRKGASLG